MPRKSNKPTPKRCGCSLTCNYFMLRCDNCHRGVHFFCLKLFDPVADRPNVYVCTTCKNNGVEEARVAVIRAAEGRPCSVIFRGSCQYHWGHAMRGHKVRPLANEHSDEVISDANCDMCNYSCPDYIIACKMCNVCWHLQCVPMTAALAERIDKWYCQRCRKKEPQLQITFKDGHDTAEDGNVMATPPPVQGHIAEEDGNATATPPPGPSSGASTSVPAEQRKKRPTTTTEATATPTKRTALDDRAAKTEPSDEAADAPAEQVPPVEASANAMPTVEEHMAVAEEPSTAALVEQLKQAADRIKKLEEENAALLRVNASAVAAKEGLQRTLDETMVESTAERQKRIAAEEGLKKTEEGLKKALDDTKAKADDERQKRIAAEENLKKAEEGLQKALNDTNTEAVAEREKRIAAEEGLKKALDDSKDEAADERQKRIAVEENLKKAEEELKKALDETKIEAVVATEHEKRIAAEEEVTKKSILIAHLTAKLVDAGQL
ncbi:hypothetical protein AAVH_30586 [Aphelenchoides avenae]|nr:hypothetical protein AAVH_30586 [Aphelenchus avenae]